jgi:hypothetical protein
LKEISYPSENVAGLGLVLGLLITAQTRALSTTTLNLLHEDMKGWECRFNELSQVNKVTLGLQSRSLSDSLFTSSGTI